MDYDSEIETLKQNQVSMSAQIMELARMQRNMAEVQLRNLETVERVSLGLDQLRVIVADLRGSVDELRGSVRELTADVAQLREAQSHTDQRLNALIDIVDELIRRPKH